MESGKIVQDSFMKKGGNKIPIAYIILGIIGAAGLITMAILAPNAIHSLTMFQRRWKNGYTAPRQQIHNTLYRAIKKGLIAAAVKENGRRSFSLTAEGKARLRRYQTESRIQEHASKWDGKWRVIIFDIQEKRKVTRDWLRAELRNIGFLKLQNSVWIFPYECEEFITLLKADAKIGREVLYMAVDRIENDTPLRKKFGLPSPI